MRAREARLQVNGETVDAFVLRCTACLRLVYSAILASIDDPETAFSLSVRWVIRLAAVMLAAGRVPTGRLPAGSLREAALAVLQAARDESRACEADYTSATRAAFDTSGVGIFASDKADLLGDLAFREAAGAMLGPRPDAPIETILFQSMPVRWLGHAYQSLLAFHPSQAGDVLEVSRAGRKSRGVYFTPPSLVSYIIESVLGPLLGAKAGSDLAVLDPAMGGGDFLTQAVDFVCDSASQPKAGVGEHRAFVASHCVFGVDIDPLSAEIARFAVWAASGFADGISDDIKSHLLCGDAIGCGDSEGIDWAEAFGSVMRRSEGGFDAVVGNPPYIAAKNGFRRGGRARGQSDSYLLFLSTAVDRALVRPGAMLSMVLPDPMLVRENASELRRTLLREWDLLSVVHVLGAFPEAVVANIVPVCRRTSPAGRTFAVSRIERAADRRAFALRPRETAIALSREVRREMVLVQPRCELLYLLEDGSFGDIIRRIHGEDASLSTYQPPFAPLGDLNVRHIYRGEEIGKAAINRDEGDMPILLGGQSIRPYEITWEGRRTSITAIAKPLDRYQSTKLLVQKSSAHVVAALDEVRRGHPGYAFPQSVYGIELRRPGMHELYLLCILNSQVINEYVRRAVTGYKMLQPQLEIEDIRALPIRRIRFTTPSAEREADVSSAVRLFEDESIRLSATAPFPELTNLVVRYLTGSPEKSDVVHDLLVHLGRLVVDLTRSVKRSPDVDVTRRLDMVRSAVEAVVWRLYSSEPAQMSLPL